MNDIQEAIMIHGADAVFTAAAGACEDYEPLRAVGLHVDDEADQIGDIVYDSRSESNSPLGSQPGSLQANNKNA